MSDQELEQEQCHTMDATAVHALEQTQKQEQTHEQEQVQVVQLHAAEQDGDPGAAAGTDAIAGTEAGANDSSGSGGGTGAGVGWQGSWQSRAWG